MTNYEVSDFMKCLLESQFPQFSLFDPQEFCKEAKNRGIQIQKSDLEYFDKKGIIRPCLRLHRPIIDGEFALLSLGHPHTWKYLYKQKYVELPKTGDFIPWKKYFDKKKEKTWLYYHTWQLLFLNEQLLGSVTKVRTEGLINPKLNLKAYIRRKRKDNKNYLEAALHKARTYHNKIIGLLMLLEEPYSPAIRHQFYPDPANEKTYTEWFDWQKTKKFSQIIHKKSGFTAGELAGIYEDLASSTNRLDPINSWNPFMELIRRNKKRQLKGDALLAQDFFEALKMLAMHIEDLTGQKMLAPIYSTPWLNNGWQERIYGKPFDLDSKKTIDKILSDYIYSRPIIASIVVEGKTEENVIRKIMKQVYVNRPEKQGIHIYNLKGVGNLKRSNIDGYITRAQLDENEIYVIVDKDAEQFLEKHRGKTLKESNITVWNTDFEGDNFSISEVVDCINKLLKKQKTDLISTEAVQKECNKKKLVDAVGAVVYKQTHLKLEPELISKPDLSLLIMRSRFTKIRKEFHGNGWEPKYPIEKVVKNILMTIPRYAR